MPAKDPRECAETRRFNDRCRWDSAFWHTVVRSDIPSTWPLVEDFCKRYGLFDVHPVKSKLTPEEARKRRRQWKCGELN